MSADTNQTTDTDKQNLEACIQFAKKFLEDLLSFFGLNTDVYATANEDDVIELHVPSTHLNGFLIGQHGDTIRALQFMTSTALRNNDYQYSRVHVDIADYKKQRAERLAVKAEEWVKAVKDSNETRELRPMNSADRRVVHKVATEHGLETESIGEGRDRRVVLKPGAGAESKPAVEPEETPETN
jgi:spoIIIJ-associated protein